MSQQLLSSKIVVEETPPKVRPFVGASLSDTACLCVTERGPFGPQLIQDPATFKKVYGNFTPNAEGALAASMFFTEGSTNLWVSRVVHYTDPGTPSSKTSTAGSVTLKTTLLTVQPAIAQALNVPYPGLISFGLNAGDTLIAKINGGGATTATFNATAAQKVSTVAQPFTLSDGLTLNLTVNGISVPVTFHTASFADITAATTAEVDAVINAAITASAALGIAGADGSHHVTLTTTQKGNAVTIAIATGTANTALGFTVSSTSGTGNVGTVDNVSATEVAAVLQTAFPGTTGTAPGNIPTLSADTSIQFTGGTALNTVGFDLLTHTGSPGGELATLQIVGKTDGAYANQIVVQLQANAGNANNFDLLVLQAGVLVESWPNLSMVPNSARYVATIINDPSTGSDLIQVVDESAAVPSPLDNPAPGSFALSGGNDGLAGLVDEDFVGSAAGLTGLRSFDRVPSLRLLIVPGQATPAVHNAMLNYCEAVRFGSMFAILDPPLNQTAQAMHDYVQQTALLQESSEFGNISWPNVKIVNPQQSVFGTASTIVVPPSGALAGMYGRNDAGITGGIYEAPAGVDVGRLRSVVGIETDEVKDENARDLVASALINPIVGLEGLPIHMDGDLTLKTTGDFPTIGERRGAIYIEQTLKANLVFSKHRKIKPSLRAALDRSTRAFMEIQRKAGAFASDDPALAYNIDYGDGLNPPSVAFARSVIGVIGIATAKPADFIILRVGQDTQALEAELAAAAA